MICVDTIVRCSSRSGQGWLAVAVLCTVFLGSGCSTELDPFTDAANERFALSGFLTMLEDVQRVRIEQLRQTVNADEIDLEGVRVVSIHEESGERQAWAPSANQPADIEGVIFESVFRPLPGTYRLEVGREDTEQKLIARTTFPDRPQVLVEPAVGVGVGVQVPLRLVGVRDTPVELGLRYTVRPPATPNMAAPDREFDIRYGQAGNPVANGWEFLVFVRNDHRIMLRSFGLDAQADSLALIGVAVIADLASDEWTDPAAIRIQNGEGFFGSVARYVVPWNAPRTAFQEGGYIFLP